jgi:hypothetical protein
LAKLQMTEHKGWKHLGQHDGMPSCRLINWLYLIPKQLSYN